MKKKVVVLLLTGIMAIGTPQITSFAQENFTEAESEILEANEEVCGDFVYIPRGTEATIIKYNGEAQKLVIPAELNGLKVTSIGKDVFRNKGQITEVEFPEGLLTIEEGAFFRCNLKQLILPESLKSIGKLAFACNDFDTVRIPAKVEKIEERAFAGTLCIAAFEVAEENAYFATYDKALYSKDFTTLYICPSKKQSIDIKGTTTLIGNFAFSDCEQLENVILPAGLKEIGYHSFGDNYQLKEIVVPASVEKIGDYFMANGAALQKIVVAEGNKNYASEGGVLYTKDMTTLIRCPEAIENLTISEKATTIETNAFFAKRSADSIVIPKNITVIKDAAFQGIRSKKVIFQNPDCVITNTDNYGNQFIDARDLTVVGYKNSTIAKYAEAYGLKFEDIEANPFLDVAEETWKYTAAHFAYEHSIMNGKGADENGKIKFDPDGTLTRAEFAQVLYNMEKTPQVEYEACFTDVPEKQWFTNAVIWVKKNDIAVGKIDKFDVFGKITRQEMATMLKKYAAYKGYSLEANADLSTYADADKISSWAVENMNWAVTNHIMRGKSETTLDPLGNATRAECAAVFKNFCEEFQK